METSFFFNFFFNLHERSVRLDFAGIAPPSTVTSPRSHTHYDINSSSLIRSTIPCVKSGMDTVPGLDDAKLWHVCHTWRIWWQLIAPSPWDNDRSRLVLTSYLGTLLPPVPRQIGRYKYWSHLHIERSRGLTSNSDVSILTCRCHDSESLIIIW